MERLASGAIRILDDPAYFRSAVNYTAAVTAFPVAPVEKDFFCTLLLEHLARNEPDLVFKGGTALAKIHAGFYRLSEDLDFTLPKTRHIPKGATADSRSCRGCANHTLQPCRWQPHHSRCGCAMPVAARIVGIVEEMARRIREIERRRPTTETV